MAKLATIVALQGCALFVLMVVCRPAAAAPSPNRLTLPGVLISESDMEERRRRQNEPQEDDDETRDMRNVVQTPGLLTIIDNDDDADAEMDFEERRRRQDDLQKADDDETRDMRGVGQGPGELIASDDDADAEEMDFEERRRRQYQQSQDDAQDDAQDDDSQQREVRRAEPYM